MVDQDSYKSVQGSRHWWTKRVGMDAVADVAAEDAITIDETLNKSSFLQHKTVVWHVLLRGVFHGGDCKDSWEEGFYHKKPPSYRTETSQN